MGLLPYAHLLVDKKINFTSDKFKEFIRSVKQVDGPIEVFDDRHVPQLIKLYSSIQAKYQGLIFKDESEYTNGQNIVLKQTQLPDTRLLYAALFPSRMNREQEKKMRKCLENATMENSERKLKHAVQGKNFYKGESDKYRQKYNQASERLKHSAQTEKDLRTGLNLCIGNIKLGIEQQRARDTEQAARDERQDAKDKRFEDAMEKMREREAAMLKS